MGFLRSLGRALKKERTPADLAKWLKLPEAELREWLGTTAAWARGYDYTRFTLPKRRGGARQIEAPSPKLKDLQRRVLRRLLNPLPAHPAATGFVRGRSIVDNARPHAGHKGAVINLDLADFFHSISAERVAQSFRGLGWNEEAATILSRICTESGRLPQGAPTSPAISNLVCHRLDERLTSLLERCGGSYTRYADDITLSLPAFGRNKRLRPTRKSATHARSLVRPVSRKLLTVVRQIIEAEGFRIQMKKKVRVQRPHQRQTATGLVVNQTVNLPRLERRRIRAMQHHERLGRLDEAATKRLRGLENLLTMIERQR